MVADDYRSTVREHVAHVLAVDLVAEQDDTALAALGMGSVDAIELMSLLRDRMGLVADLHTLVRARTIAQLAELVRAQHRGA